LSERLLHPSFGDIPSFSQRSEDISIQNILREGSDEGQNVPTLRWFVGFDKNPIYFSEYLLGIIALKNSMDAIESTTKGL